MSTTNAVASEFRASPVWAGLSNAAVFCWLRGYWFIIVALAIFAIPGVALVARQSWMTEQGAHGPMVLAAGLWLLWRDGKSAKKEPGKLSLAATAMLPLLAVYVFSMIIGISWLLWISMMLCGVLVIYALGGGNTTRALWFPLVFLMFAVPPPSRLTAPLTDFLTSRLSGASVNLLWYAGYDVARSGVDIYIDQYELRMADACAGLNSLFSLVAIGMFYIYLRHRADWRYALVLSVFVPPIAVLANFARVVILMLVTHGLGAAAAQSILHETTGLLMFVVALCVLMAIDALLGPLRRRLGR
ncbi:exosortase [Novosphingobium album (ex Hu et al. 2023)]|uniref:Exosortase n=1 Tax=Novosphingobium album (ex Hu et al. 2023) TaxID=2930093 RepID=A0ABT0B4W7_9SPHN|nr:exosortase [Novosphingobium album (ex Hu et al. 2023)]MCJ2180058.1 exosortase [Novosphingobium album (ex Hu et al. 2023)]